MPKIPKLKFTTSSCLRACTSVIKFATDLEIPASAGVGLAQYTKIGGYRHINIFVEFTQQTVREQPVDLGVIFAFDKNGDMGARCYVNLEANLPGPQSVNFINVSGSGAWHGSQQAKSSFMARFPVMGPYVKVFINNRAPVKRKVSVWGYLVS